MWRPGHGHSTIVEQEADKDSVVDCLRVAQDHPEWQSLRVLQLLLSYEDMALSHESPAEASGRNTPEASSGTNPSYLEPILEESEASSLAPESATEYLVHDDPEWQAVLNSLRDDWTSVLEEAPPAEDQEPMVPARLPLEYLQQSYLDMEVRPPEKLEPMDEESSTAELAIYPPMTNTVPDAPYVGPNEMLVYKTSKQSGTRRLITQRDDDLLTPEEVRLRWREVEVAMLKELRTWAELKCFSRKPRHQASNIIDVRWVLKNKWEQPTVDASTGGSGTTEAEKLIKSMRAEGTCI